jgi:hypothetical protein
MKQGLAILLIFFSYSAMNAQQTTKVENPAIIMFSPSFSLQYPMGDNTSLYGVHSKADMNISLKTKSNWTFGFGAGFGFGASPKDFTLLGDMVSNGVVIGKNANIEQPSLEGRIGTFNVEIGKIIPIFPKSKISGIHFKAGIGYLSQKTITTIDGNIVPQLNDNYAGLYNQSMAGLSLSQFIGYTYFSRDKLINITFGLEHTVAFVKSLNTWDVKTNTSIADKKATYRYLGPKFTFTIPLYIKDKKYFEKTYFYN